MQDGSWHPQPGMELYVGLKLASRLSEQPGRALVGTHSWRECKQGNGRSWLMEGGA